MEWVILGLVLVAVAGVVYTSKKRHKKEGGDFNRPGPGGNEQER